MHPLRYKAGRMTNMRIWHFTANLMKACENYSISSPHWLHWLQYSQYYIDCQKGPKYKAKTDG